MGDGNLIEEVNGVIKEKSKKSREVKKGDKRSKVEKKREKRKRK